MTAESVALINAFEVPEGEDDPRPEYDTETSKSKDNRVELRLRQPA